MEGNPSLCGYYSGFGKPAARTGNPKPCSHEGIPSVELLYLSGCGALSVRLTYINVLGVDNGNTCRETHLSFYKESKINAEWRALRP